MTRNLAKRLAPITPKPECACWRDLRPQVITGNGASPHVVPPRTYNPECPVHGQAVTE